jgi:hypothetical protein
LEKWGQAPYDGIKGTPPEWIQKPCMSRFYSARTKVFHLARERRMTYEDLRKQFKHQVEYKYAALVMALVKQKMPTYDDGLDTLVEIFKAVQLGEEEGLRLLAGDIAVKGYHAKVAVRKRPDFVDKPRVQQIGKLEWALNPTATFKEIINSPGLKPFVDKYSDRTLQLWLRAIDPRDQRKSAAGQPVANKVSLLSSLITFIP